MGRHASSSVSILFLWILLGSASFLCAHIRVVQSFQPLARQSVRTLDIRYSKRLNLEYSGRSHKAKVPFVERRTRLYKWMTDDDDLQGSDRIKACIPYMLPLLDGDFFGKYIYQRIPPLGTLDQILIAPLVSILQSFPFLSLILFCLFTLGARNAQGLSRNVRYNAQQAVLIDIVLIFPTIIYEGLADVDVPRVWAEFGCNFVWYFYTSAIMYSVIMNLRGKKPDGLPILSDAAEFMTGPF